MNNKALQSGHKVSGTLTLTLRHLNEGVLIRVVDQRNTDQGVALSIETPRPLLFVDGQYGWHWGCTIRNTVEANTKKQAMEKARQWAKGFLEFSERQSTEVSGPVIE